MGSAVLERTRDVRIAIGQSRKLFKTERKRRRYVLLSDDHGESWYPSETIRGRNTWLIENAVVELETDDHLLMVFRTKAGYVFRSESLDGGQTWTDVVGDERRPESKLENRHDLSPTERFTRARVQRPRKTSRQRVFPMPHLS